VVERKLRWGVLSTANIGKHAVIPAIQASANGQVIAIASREADKAAAIAANHGLPRFYGSYEAMLDAEDIEAVYIPLPNSMHKDWTIRAVSAKKHVLCEKPLALSSSECLEMEEAAIENGVKLMEAFMYRFHPRTKRIMELVNKGELGKLAFINAAFTFRLRNAANIRLNKDLGGGSLMDVGCYCINIIRTLAASEPVEVQAYANFAGTGVDIQMAGGLRFADDLLANFHSGLNLERRETFTAAGTDGHLDVPSCFLPGKTDVHFSISRGREERLDYTIPGVDQYELMVSHFADCVLNDQPVRYPPAEAAANMRVIEGLYRSALQQGKPVVL
jgi:D-xylose 1-dehydrogenase (NADP+, D-xylono-1,5-lactone-forming)